MKSPLNHHENNGYNPIHIPISYLFHPKSHSQNSILPHLYTILDFHHFIMVYPSPHPVTPLCLERDSPMGRQRGVSHFCVNRQGFGFANAEGPPLATAPATSWGWWTIGKAMGKPYVRWCPRERNRVQLGSHNSHNSLWVFVGDISIVFMGFINQFFSRLGGTTL